GGTGDYGFGSDATLLPQYAWYGQRGNVGTRPVGQQRRANAWGLYDMHGNVWEWVEDCWHANYEGAPRDGRAWIAEGGCKERVLRGGGWSSAAPYLRSSVRGSYAYDLDDVSNGFRLAKTP
ncbi:MAG: serine/threonine kinase, partial [Halothiobacillaceae bacterium]